MLSLAALAGAVEWDGPKPTPVNQFALSEFGFSPKPTEPPRIRGRMAGHELFARDEPAVLCGYVSGISSQPVTCPDFRRTCFFNTNVKAVGCCSHSSDPPESCAQYTSCIDSTAITSCTGSCSNNLLVTTCSDSASPYCQTYQWTSGYRNLGCGVSYFSQNVEFTYSGQPITFGSSTNTPIIFITSATVTAPSSTISASGAAAASEGSNAGTVTSNKSSSNVGAIAGGVVGGLAALVALALGIFYLMRRKRNDRASASAAAAAAAAAAGGTAYKPTPSAPPMQQQYGNYDPNMPPQAPFSPAPQYNPHQPVYYDPSTGAAPLPMKAEYSQNAAPVNGQQMDQTAQTIHEMPYNPATSPAPQTQSPPPPQQFQRPQGPIYEAPNDSH